MMTSSTLSLPPTNTRTLTLMVLAGAFATMAFDFWGQVLSPLLGFARLSPDGLARSLLGTFGLPNGREHGQFMHLVLIGLIAYPIGWMYIFKPLWARFVGFGGWILPSAVYGAGLWVFAIGGITVIAGLPSFLNFSAITWVALVGHTLYGIALVWALERFNPRDA